MIKKNDLKLIGIIILLGLAAIAYTRLTRTEGSKLVVTVDGEVYQTFPLNEDAIFTIEGEDGTYNTFEIKSGYVNMTDASCPDKICVNHRKIHYNHETIVCLPNKVVLEIEDAQDSDVDIIAN